jgi:hypothetical protein
VSSLLFVAVLALGLSILLIYQRIETVLFVIRPERGSALIWCVLGRLWLFSHLKFLVRYVVAIDLNEICLKIVISFLGSMACPIPLAYSLFAPSLACEGETLTFHQPQGILCQSFPRFFSAKAFSGISRNVNVAKGTCSGFRTSMQSTLYEAAASCLATVASDRSTAFNDTVVNMLLACNERTELAHGWRCILEHNMLKIKLLPVLCAAWHVPHLVPMRPMQQQGWDSFFSQRARTGFR